MQNLTIKLGVISSDNGPLSRDNSSLFTGHYRCNVKILGEHGEWTLVPEVLYAGEIGFMQWGAPRPGQLVVVACFGEQHTAESMVILAKMNPNMKAGSTSLPTVVSQTLGLNGR